MREALSVIITRFQDYFAGSGFGLLFFACLLFLLFWKRDRKIRDSLFWPVLIIVLAVFCPATGWLLMKLVGTDVYWRMYWLLPVVPLAAYAGTTLVFGLKGKGKKILLTAVCLALIAVNGTFVFSDTYFEDRENNYKLPTQVIWVADAINEHARENRIKRKKILAPSYVAVYIRIYDASIRQRYGRNLVNHPDRQQEVYELINSDDPDYEKLAARVRKAKSRYVVLKDEADDQQTMETMGFEKIYDSDAFDVYFNLDFQKN